MPNIVDVAVIGAGPYGLSLAAHLKDTGTSFRIFGKPMSSWRDHMPKDMCLKSDGFASNLSAPCKNSTLEAWCAANGVAYSAQDVPVKLGDFVAYADWFTRTYVPSLETLNVIDIKRDMDGLYTLTLENKTTTRARRVVMAVGITWFKKMPDGLKHLPAAHVSHSWDHKTADQFKGKEVVVLGAGASAINTAIMFHDAGAKVTIVARRKSIPFHSAPDNEEPTLLKEITNPTTGIGPGWRSFFCTYAPLLFHKMPEKFRLEVTRRHLGPAPGWFTREKVEGHIPAKLGVHLDRADLVDGRVAIQLRDDAGATRILMADHVVAATGYKPDLASLPFLDTSLRENAAQVAGTPILSDNFETSVPGLYFIGLSAANSFGPLLRFMVGAEFAAPRLSAHLNRSVTSVFQKAA